MANRKSTRRTAADLGLTPHEEQLLENFFRRKTRPYLGALVAAVCVLGGVWSLGVPGDAQPAVEDDGAEIEALRGDLQSRFDAQLASVRAELSELEAAIERKRGPAPKSDGSDAKARKRLDDVEYGIRSLKNQLSELQKQSEKTRDKLASLEDRRLVEDALATEAEAPPPPVDQPLPVSD